MINTLSELKRRSLALGLCDRYRGEWDACASDRELFDMATDINGLGYIADATTFRWGGSFDTDYIARRFAGYINGAYRRDKDGYSTALYCNHEGTIRVGTTVVCILGCKGTVIVPYGSYASIIVGAGSDIHIISMGKVSDLTIYGEAKVSGTARIADVKHITESGWRR